MSALDERAVGSVDTASDEKERTLSVRALGVETLDGRSIVRDVDFDVPAGEMMGLIGESGSGKTTTGLACLGYAQRGARIVCGTVTLPDGTEILGLPESTRAPLRGRIISYVPQDPGSSLNPRRRIRDHFYDRMRTGSGSRENSRILELLDQVRLPAAKDFASRFAHELSGGQQQRVLIALALVHRPAVIVFDEPTTGLDVTTQAHVLAIIDELRREFGTTMLYITHDQSVVADIAQSAAVMYGGRVVEVAASDRLFREPLHPYTSALIAAAPRGHEAGHAGFRGIPGTVPSVGDTSPGCTFLPRCDVSRAECETNEPKLLAVETTGSAVACHRAREWVRVPEPEPSAFVELDSSLSAPTATTLAVCGVFASYAQRRVKNAERVPVLRDVSLEVPCGRTVAIVGESGSGKSTLARCIAGLHRPDQGEILLNGEPLGRHARDRTQHQREAIGLVFQNPAVSLNPLHRVEQLLARPLEVRRGLSSARRKEALRNALELVRLSDTILSRYPRELSGGQQQRVAIGRALVLSPQLLVCDEITASLDVSVQASILELLLQIQADTHMSVVFISHDLAVVRSVANHVVVLKDGVIRESGSTETVFASPEDDYTRSLMAASLALD